MFDKFLSIDQEKQQRVINASLKVFALKGYEAASTNEIAREAGISKGLLFHYFTSKKDLYLYLYDYAVDLITEKVNEFVDPRERDFFERLKQITNVKMAIYDQFPDLLTFQKTIYFEESAEVSSELKARSKLIAENAYHKLFSDIDTSKFKEGVDVKRAMNVILWSLEGLADSERERHKALGIDLDIPHLLEEYERYVQLFKTSFYKQS
ncbi:TetR/AcrR family transcriptional regulator [Paenibacillus sp. LHD-117]|uniref:TetR/AcrR family transcriptional regulator n=1 Tax=Paenibacillus sp. LHD-117 TaxID=3071412 RepID=UPI0027DF1E97|nr:TetR/AcrR family transcriptional regulator [Paenibacillus sp. LHD-117]MDQ6418827.1 TetR/AcrR family transcriptional regulator [Paenibacillus sp. LHD-117]